MAKSSKWVLPIFAIGVIAMVKKGSKVKVEYTGTFDDGTVFDSSEKHGQPLEFEAGAGQVIKGFDDAIIAMKKGEERTIHIEAKDAYGEHNPQLVKIIPKENLPEGAKVGTVLAIGLPTGQRIPATVTKVSAKEATIDINHPLAGKALNFKLKIVDSQ